MKRSLIITRFRVLIIISLLIGGIRRYERDACHVAERQREVGVREATVGAQAGDIINRFAIEAAIIGSLGGILGYGI